MKKIKSFITICKQLNYVLTDQEKRSGIRVFLISFLGSIFELISVSIILPFIQALIEPKKLLGNIILAKVTNALGIEDDLSLILFLGLLVVGLFVIKNIYLLWACYMQKRYATQIYKNLSTNMLNSYMKRPYTYFLNMNSANIIRGISGDTDGVYEIIQNIFALITELVAVLLISMFLIYSDIFMAFGALGLAFIALIVLVGVLQGKMKRAGMNSRKANIKASKYAYQAVNGIKEITVMQRRNNFVQMYGNAIEQYQKMLLVSTFLSACPDRILEGVCVGGFIGIACVRIVMGVDVISFVPTLAVFAMAAFKVLPSISKIVNKSNMIIYYQPALNEAFDNIKAARKYQKDLDTYSALKLLDQKVDNIRFKEELSIENIFWRYENSENILRGCSLKIFKGESVAFIGTSGAGKTTLADILMGLLKPQKGTIKMDGIEVFAMPHQWARIIGYVPQTVFLIDDTIRSNVAFGIKEDEIVDERVWNALEEAQIKNFVEELPQGLDTIVGERGIKFSGGQRQRIAIARALYENPDILVLDEATSALDNETEKAVMESIDALQGSKTLIIVAHRLTTIKNCDKIYEIRDGIAIERKKEEIFC